MTDKDDPTQEAARALAARLRALDFAETDPASGLRALERTLEDFAGAVPGAGGKSARSDAWAAIATSIEALGAALEGEQRARAIDRMRLAEGLRRVASAIAEAERLATRTAEVEREVQARDARIVGLEAGLAAMRDEVRARDASIAGLDAERERLTSEGARAAAELTRVGEEVAHLRAIVDQPGHRLVTRTGAMLDRHPRIAAMAGAIVRGVNRLFDRSGR